MFTANISAVHKDTEIGRRIFTQIACYTLTSTWNACVETFFLSTCKWHWTIWYTQMLIFQQKMDLKTPITTQNDYFRQASFPCNTCKLVLERTNIIELNFIQRYIIATFCWATWLHVISVFRCYWCNFGYFSPNHVILMALSGIIDQPFLHVKCIIGKWTLLRFTPRSPTSDCSALPGGLWYATSSIFSLLYLRPSWQYCLNSSILAGSLVHV